MSIAQAFRAFGPAASVALTTGPQTIQIIGDGDVMMICNACAVSVQVDFQGAAFSATAASPYVIPPASTRLVTVGRASSPVTPGVPPPALFASAFPVGTASGNVYFTRGDGIVF